MLTVIRRLLWWASALILGVGCIILIIFLRDLWRVHHHEVAWGDVSTWLGSIVLLIGLPAALVQLNLQRIQLRDQQRELRERQVLLERQQANRINLTMSASTTKPRDFAEEGRVWMAVLTNESDRPVRNVICRIRTALEADLLPTKARIGELVDSTTAQEGRVFRELSSDAREVAIMRIKSTYGFAFGVNVDQGAYSLLGSFYRRRRSEG